MEPEEQTEAEWLGYDDLGRYIDVHDYVWEGDDE